MKRTPASSVLGSVVIFLFATTLVADQAHSAMVTSAASGSISPGQVDAPSTTNGDFLISRSSPVGPTNRILGDGWNERTNWTFDFSSDSEFPSFSPFPPAVLDNAILTMEITPTEADTGFPDPQTITDVVAIVGLPFIVTPIIQQLPPDTSLIEIDLLDFYTSNNILTAYQDSEFGQIDMLFGDDATVSFAQLELSTIPEPTTLLILIGLGCMGLSRGTRVA